MPKVTSVEPQKKNPKRFNIFLDGVFAFGADQDTIVNFRLVPGKVIEQKDLETIIFETQVGKILDRMYAWFGVRQRSEGEVRQKFKIKNLKLKIQDKEQISDIVVESAIQKLKEKKLIDDLEFAKSWVESRSRKLGPNVLKMELIKKGIDREVIEEVMNIKDENSKDPIEVARALLEKRIDRVKNLPEPEKKKKLLEFLIRRGFDYSLARDLVEETLRI